MRIVLDMSEEYYRAIIKVIEIIDKCKHTSESDKAESEDKK